MTPVIRPLTASPAWKSLEAHYQKIRGLHLRELLADDPKRVERMTIQGFRSRGIRRPGLGFGRGRWTIEAAIDEGVPVPVLTTALYERFSSRGDADYQDKLLSAMRYGFGGHLEKSAK